MGTPAVDRRVLGNQLPEFVKDYSRSGDGLVTRLQLAACVADGGCAQSRAHVGRQRERVCECRVWAGASHCMDAGGGAGGVPAAAAVACPSATDTARSYSGSVLKRRCGNCGRRAAATPRAIGARIREAVATTWGEQGHPALAVERAGRSQRATRMALGELGACGESCGKL